MFVKVSPLLFLGSQERLSKDETIQRSFHIIQLAQTDACNACMPLVNEQ